jgi:hypothetical protein
MVAAARRKDYSVVFERGFDTHLMAIGGTWRRACIMTAGSDSGAKALTVRCVSGGLICDLVGTKADIATFSCGRRLCGLSALPGSAVYRSPDPYTAEPSFL